MWIFLSFLCEGVRYTTFLCYRGRSTLVLLMFSVWTWIFPLFKKTDLPLSPFFLKSVLQLGGSGLQICSLGSRGRQICSRYKHNQNFWDTTLTVTWAGSGSNTRTAGNKKLQAMVRWNSALDWSWFGIWAQGLYFFKFRQRINISKWIIFMIKQKFRAGWVLVKKSDNFK